MDDSIGGAEFDEESAIDFKTTEYLSDDSIVSTLRIDVGRVV